MDSYQPIYDAVRSRIGGANVSSVLEGAVERAFDISHTRAILQEQFCAVAMEMMRPSVIYRPALFPDGNMWCALYGTNLTEGVAGFGDTPEDAMRAFDRNWQHERTPQAARKLANRIAEDDACERTLKRLAEHAEVMGVTVEQALNDVIPDTRARLERYMKRKASPQPAGFKRLGE